MPTVLSDVRFQGWAAGESAAAIADLLKRSAHAVRKRAHVLNIMLARSPPGPKPKWK